jgi:predicted dehydrogenase
MNPVPPHRLRFGVLGTARIGHTSVNPAIQSSRNAELVAVASRDLGMARDFAQVLSIPRHYGGYEALLDDPDIDAVYIPLPNSLHREWTIRAAEKKKHILCEKPLALSVAECLEMQAAADAHGVTLMEAFMYRFHPRIRRLVEMTQARAVGELRGVRSAFTFRLTRPENIRLRPDLGGGALMDVGCYCVDISRRLAGTLPIEVQAWALSGGSSSKWWGWTGASSPRPRSSPVRRRWRSSSNGVAAPKSATPSPARISTASWLNTSRMPC